MPSCYACFEKHSSVKLSIWFHQVVISHIEIATFSIFHYGCCTSASFPMLHDMLYVVKQKCTTWPPIKFGDLVIIINKKVYLHYDNKKEFLIIKQWNIRVNNYICSRALFFDNVQLDNLTPKDVYLGQGEKIKKIREIIKQNSINKRIFDNKTIKYQSK